MTANLAVDRGAAEHARVVYVEDDARLGALTSQYLRVEGIEVSLVTHGERLPHLGVATVTGQQLLVGSFFGHAAAVEHHDAVGGAGGLQPVGDQDAGSTLGHDPHGPIDKRQRSERSRTTRNLSARLEALVLTQQEPAFPRAASSREVSN